MICIECTNPNIDCLYSKYESDYIKLTICPECGKIADKYIEYDNVILFIDLLLLKTRAYRHLAYNVTEQDILNESQDSNLSSDTNKIGPRISLSSFVLRYKKLLRLILLIVLFEVYLKWAYEERKSIHTIGMDFILNQPVHVQYSFFITESIIEQFLLNFVILVLFRLLLNLKELKNINISEQLQFGYQNSVLLVTILSSSSIKLFPILMLIWPYDTTSISAAVINVIGYLYIIEGLKIISNKSYFWIILILAISITSQFLISKRVLSFIVSRLSGIDLDVILQSDYNEIYGLYNQYRLFIYDLRDNLIN
ncbi:Arv1-like family-domain-containing protein [Scheffersomyces coipomensis]|uniref:Arv1-like family-domain-containing protein n=1 Tax=Scheffersomyces coipomensis TaxID=1788519 RepID=UPI00315C9437